jgi:hypothetical protein
MTLTSTARPGAVVAAALLCRGLELAVRRFSMIVKHTAGSIPSAKYA